MTCSDNGATSLGCYDSTEAEPTESSVSECLVVGNKHITHLNIGRKMPIAAYSSHIPLCHGPPFTAVKTSLIWVAALTKSAQFHKITSGIPRFSQQLWWAKGGVYLL